MAPQSVPPVALLIVRFTMAVSDEFREALCSGFARVSPDSGEYTCYAAERATAILGG